MFAAFFPGCSGDAAPSVEAVSPTLLSSPLPKPEATKSLVDEDEYHLDEQDSESKHLNSQYASSLEAKRRLRRIRAEELEVEKALAAKSAADRLAAEEALVAQRESERQELCAWLEENGYSEGGRALRVAGKVCSFRATKKTWMRDCAWPPLHAAVVAKNARMVSLIMQFGGDENAPNSLGQTAFTLALSMNKNGSHKQVLQTLHDCTVSSLIERMSTSAGSSVDSRVVSHDDDEW